MEVIAVWAEHEYKPAIGACLDMLSRRDGTLPREETPIAMRSAFTAQSIPWMFELWQPSRDSQDGNARVIPELEGYKWFSNQTSGEGDSLMIRIGIDGHVRRPVVVFGSRPWDPH